jgi:chemotaxis protein CheD
VSTGALLTEAPPRMPLALPGFEHITRYWDREHGSYVAKILPGEYYVTTNAELVMTVLGSCVSACVRDPVFGVGGMNHFMLPESRDGTLGSWHNAGNSAATRFGNFAMERLINDILKHGGTRQRLEVKIFGGGRILAKMTDIGQHNVTFIKEYLGTEGLRMVSEDTGDVFPRKVVYAPASGRAWVKRLRSMHSNTIVERETSYLKEIETKPPQGKVELF